MNPFRAITAGINIRSLVPYLAAIALFLVMTLAYVSPVLEGKRLKQPDIVNWQGMSKEITDFRDQTGEEALWTNSMFGGMPAFQISVQWANNIAGFFHNVMTLWLPRPADMIFLYFAGFFIFLLMLKVNPWIAFAGAVGFAFSSYHFIIIEAGHNSKAVAIGYMAPVLGSIIYTFRRNILTGGVFFAVFMGLQLYANHFQMTYYLAIAVVFYGLVELYEHLRREQALLFFKKFGVLTAALVLAVGINIGNFWGTWSYTSETMRGGSELTIGDETRTSGLSKEYITNWSYGIGETFTLLIPNAKGGATGPLGQHKTALDQVNPAYRNIIAQENHYWGDQPFTSGPVYVGVVVLFFFFLALFLEKSRLKWALLAAIILGIMLSWGKNFMPLTDFFIDYVPGYNKFRAVSMTLVIVELCIPALAFLGMYRLYENPGILSVKHTAFLTALGLTAALSLLFYLFPKQFFSFASAMETQAYRQWAADEPMMAAQIRDFVQNLEAARVAIFRSDAIRSFFFALAAGGITLLYASKKMGKPLFVLLVVAAITLDMWPVNRRYLNNDNFVHRRVAERPYDLRAADQYILADQDQFRVLDLTVSTFNNAHTSYFHHSIGGYHGAKLQRYQDLIDVHIMDEMQRIGSQIAAGRDNPEGVDFLAGHNVLNMLNTRYIIYHPQAEPIRNPFAAGNAWFVNRYTIVDHADEEILKLEHIDLKNEAVIDRRFAHQLDNRAFMHDAGAEITLIHYQPNKLQYRYKATSDQLALFSEIYYPDGWQVRINGEKAEYFRANYILRAMVLPAGSHVIEFEFRPASYYTGKNIALFFSILIVLAIAYVVFRALRKAMKASDNNGHS
ncbi:MAG: YfhO family protein [Bacteroidales bacterium]|nr:YfhO family protein [Bacteroidales bacterium]